MKAYTFGPFLLNETIRRLSRGGKVVPLTTKLLNVLLLLVKHHGQVVTKETLLTEIWPDSFVEENNLTVAVSALRRVLGETPKEHIYIETVPKQGYRFVALVNEIDDESSPPNFFEKAQAASLVMTEESESPTPLAVLPLININNNPEIDYLSDGIAESIITCFSKLPRLRVMAYSTVARYRGEGVDPREVGRTLGVRAVLRGNIRHLSDRIVIGMELVNVDDGAQLWGEQYKLQFSNIFEVQEKIINEVSNNLLLRLTLEEKRQLRPDDTVNSEAYRHYLKGRYFMGKRTVSNIMKGLEYFYKAVGEDEGYNQAYAGLADCYSLLGSYGVMPEREAFVKAKPLVEKALARDPNLAEAHVSMGLIKAYNWAWTEAESHYRRAIELQPYNPQARRWYSLLLMWLSRFEQAERELRYALSLNPLSPHINTALGVHFLFSRQYDLAVTWCCESLELDPAYYNAHAALGIAYLEMGLPGEAIETHKRAYELSGEPEALSMLGNTYARTGHKAEALKAIELLAELSRHRYIKPYYFAIIYIGLEDKTSAFNWLEKAVEDKNDLTVLLNIDPRVDNLRADPRLINLLRRMALLNN